MAFDKLEVPYNGVVYFMMCNTYVISSRVDISLLLWEQVVSCICGTGNLYTNGGEKTGCLTLERDKWQPFGNHEPDVNSFPHATPVIMGNGVYIFGRNNWTWSFTVIVPELMLVSCYQLFHGQCNPPVLPAGCISTTNVFIKLGLYTRNVGHAGHAGTFNLQTLQNDQ